MLRRSLQRKCLTEACHCIREGPSERAAHGHPTTMAEMNRKRRHKSDDREGNACTHSPFHTFPALHTLRCCCAFSLFLGPLFFLVVSPLALFAGPSSLHPHLVILLYGVRACGGVLVFLPCQYFLLLYESLRFAKFLFPARCVLFARVLCCCMYVYVRMCALRSFCSCYPGSVFSLFSSACACFISFISFCLLLAFS